MEPIFSFIIPVYNRPEELNELLNSLTTLDFDGEFEAVIVEDGSLETSREVVDGFSKKLDLSYFEKSNTGPGDSRNYGMKRARGNYFLILDSDCILPRHYLKTVSDALKKNYVDCYGGPDTDHPSFTALQKAINYTMTSLLTTGGIRGNKAASNGFQPRSFNMGLSKSAFEATGGFGNIHPGEDPDLSIRLKKMGFTAGLIADAYVHHKRRISWKRFYKQVNKFGLARPVLNKWHPETAKMTYWFPTLFCLGFILSLILYFFGIKWPVLCYIIYFVVLVVHALLKTGSVKVSVFSILATGIQFFGYGWGYLRSFWLVHVRKRKPENVLPELFFKNKSESL